MHEQQCEAAGGPSLSLVDNIKTYFINNTRYFNTRFYNVIKIYKVQHDRCFGCRHCRISAMELCTMARITDRLLTMRRTGQLPPSLPYPQTGSCSHCSFMFVPPLHPPLLCGSLFLVGCCVFVSSAAVQGLNVIIFIFLHLSASQTKRPHHPPAVSAQTLKSYD